MNRPNLLRTAIESVLIQSFTNFELLISDNSNDHASLIQNQEFISKHKNDSRVKYFNPPQWMNMPDHWEFASKHAKGKYVLILTDRHVMRPSVLQVLNDTIIQSNFDVDIIAWNCGSIYNSSGIINNYPFTGEISRLEAVNEITEFAKCNNWKTSPIWVNKLPRILNSCYSSKTADLIRNKYGRMFIPISPDYAAAFLSLAVVDYYLFIDRPLYMSHGIQSNGNKGLVYGNKEYVLALGINNLFPDAPTNLYTGTNSIIQDLMKVKKIVGEKYSGVNVDYSGYIMSNYKELIYMQRIGSQRDINSLEKQLRDHIQLLPKDQQELINLKIKDLAFLNYFSFSIRKLAVKYKVDFIYIYFISIIIKIKHILNKKPVYKNIIDAAVKTDFMITQNY